MKRSGNVALWCPVLKGQIFTQTYCSCELDLHVPVKIYIEIYYETVYFGTWVQEFRKSILLGSGPCSVFGLATGYGLDGPGIECWWGRDFPHLSLPTLGPTQPLVQWVPGPPRGKEQPGRDADPSTPSSAVVKKEEGYNSTPPMGRTACTEPQCLYKGALYLFYTACIFKQNVNPNFGNYVQQRTLP